MKIGQFSKIVLIAFICATTQQISESQALAITNDIKSGINNVKNWFNDLKDLKIVQDTISFAQKTSAAIGEAKESISEYGGDIAAEIAEKKKMYEDYKAQVDEYREEYEEYKREYEEYKKMAEDGIQQAKDLKEQATETVGAAKEIASAAGDIASSKINSVKEKAGLGSSSEGGSNGLSVSGADSESAVETGELQPESTLASSGTALTGGEENSAVSPTSSRVAFSGNQASANNEALAVNNTAGSTAQQAITGNGVASLGAQNMVGAIPSGNMATGQISQNKAITGNVNLNTQNALGVVKAGNVAVNRVGGVSISNNVGALSNASSPTLKGNAVSIQAIQNSGNTATKQVIENPYTTKSIQKRLQEKTLEVSPTRKVFSKDKMSFYEESYKGKAKIAQNSKLAFAKFAVLEDNGTDINKNFIIPKPIAKRCGLTSETALNSTGRNKYAIDECLVSINDSSSGALSQEFKNPRQDYYDGKRELAIVYMVEGYKALSDVQKMTDDIVPSISFAQTDTTKDIYSQIVETNKTIVTTISGLLKLYTTKVLLESYDNYDISKYDFRTQTED